MSARTKARKRALDVLYVADIRGESIPATLAVEQQRAAAEPDRQASWQYAREIAEGFVAHQDEIDELIETYSVNWTLARMPAVDRAILRIGIWEILFNADVPDGVAISERRPRVVAVDGRVGVVRQRHAGADRGDAGVAIAGRASRQPVTSRDAPRPRVTRDGPPVPEPS